jgi:TetR/AcrR family transcriptional regulator
MTNTATEKILEAALEVVSNKKISGTRMHLIAEQAGMSQSNLHYYFPTKNDLLRALLEGIQHKFYEKRQIEIDLEKKSFEENLRGFFKNKKDIILNDKKIDYAQFDYWVQGTVNPEIRSILQESYNAFRGEIKKVLGSKNISDANDHEMLPFLIFSVIMGASMQFLIDEDKFDLDKYFQAAEKMIIDSLSLE